MAEGRYAIVSGGIVSNVVIADPAEWSEPGMVLVPEGVAVGPGYAYDGRTFSPPASPGPTADQQVAKQQAQAIAAYLEANPNADPGMVAALLLAQSVYAQRAGS